MGFDSRECTPELVRVAMHLGAEVRSYQRAADVLHSILSNDLSAKSIERLVLQIGGELCEQQATSLPAKEVVVPEVAVVSCDGGRIHTREAGHGPGVHEAKWRESKNASFERMYSPERHESDPCPALPDTFRQVAHVAKIAEKAAFEASDPTDERPAYKGPKRILRTCLSSLVCSAEFGPQMEREASRRRFAEAGQRVFIGDGLPWNWSIWRDHFPTFTPILDFIHVVQHLYEAAQAWEQDDASRWSRYLEIAEAVWQGRCEEVIEQLTEELKSRGVNGDEPLPEDSPHRLLVDVARYLRTNRERMNYPSYRQAGLPITSAPMESLIKQINHRVKGTEMFWNDPRGAEAILQLRSAALSEDGRLDDYLRRRPGYPFVRRPAPTTAA